MNNEEAKEYATKMSYTDAIYNLSKAKSVPYRKATFMKINELLSQMDCDDCISRQYLLDNCVVDKVSMPYVPISRIENAPPVTSQPKTGHWIRVTDKTGHLVWECDRCGWQQRFNTNFCPDCGGRMVEPLESEDNE